VQILKSKFYGGVDLTPQIKPRVKKLRKRRYDGATIDRFSSDWVAGQSRSPSFEILPYLTTMITRSRDLAQNNDYVKGFIKRVKTQLIPAHGRHQGMRLQSRAMDNGELLEQENATIEAAWSRFSRLGHCDVTRLMTMADIIAIAAQTLVRDGAVFVRRLTGFGNDDYFAVQLLEVDYLDFELTLDLGGGRKIIGGVELDEWGAPVNYYFLQNHPGSSLQGYKRDAHKIIPARELIYLGVQDAPEQYHYAPWFHASLIRMRMLGKYEESEAIASRIAANKMGFYTTQEGVSYTGDDLTDIDTDEVLEDEGPDFLTQAEPGVLEELPPGVGFATFDPQHPSKTFADFCRHMLRGVSAGQNVSYINFASDLREANFASMRQGELSERDMWMLFQAWIGYRLMNEIFEPWLLIQMLSGRLPYRVEDFGKLNRPYWQGKRWAWIDPLKDAKAADVAITNRTKTPGDVIEEGGGDFDETMAKWKRQLPVLNELFGGNYETNDSKGQS